MWDVWDQSVCMLPVRPQPQICVVGWIKETRRARTILRWTLDASERNTLTLVVRERTILILILISGAPSMSVVMRSLSSVLLPWVRMRRHIIAIRMGEVALGSLASGDSHRNQVVVSFKIARWTTYPESAPNPDEILSSATRHTSNRCNKLSRNPSKTVSERSC